MELNTGTVKAPAARITPSFSPVPPSERLLSPAGNLARVAAGTAPSWKLECNRRRRRQSNLAVGYRQFHS
jgi:hypothetical protein